MANASHLATEATGSQAPAAPGSCSPELRLADAGCDVAVARDRHPRNTAVSRAWIWANASARPLFALTPHSRVDQKRPLVVEWTTAFGRREKSRLARPDACSPLIPSARRPTPNGAKRASTLAGADAPKRGKEQALASRSAAHPRRPNPGICDSPARSDPSAWSPGQRPPSAKNPQRPPGACCRPRASKLLATLGTMLHPWPLVPDARIWRRPGSLFVSWFLFTAEFEPRRYPGLVCSGCMRCKNVAGAASRGPVALASASGDQREACRSLGAGCGLSVPRGASRLTGRRCG
jgi:hypothetical protein